MSRRGSARSVSAIVGGAIALLIALAGPAPAQTLNNTFGGLSENSDQPIDIESDTLTVYDAKKYATFKGNVKAVQGSTTLRATELARARCCSALLAAADRSVGAERGRFAREAALPLRLRFAADEDDDGSGN